MRIANITLRNFRCHEDARFDLQPVTVFTGPNGTGKSSVGEALRLALTGKTETLNDRNEGISDLIRRGEKKAEIVLELPEGDSIIRRIPGGLSITGSASTTTQKDAEVSLGLMMGARPDQARLALGPRLWRLDPKNRKEVLGDLLRIYYTTEDVRAALEEQGEVSGLNLATLTREVCGSITNDLAGMESRVRDARAACKKDLDRAQHRLEELQARSGSPVEAPDQTEIQKARLEVSTVFGAHRQFEIAEKERQKAQSRLDQLLEELGDRVPVPDQVFKQGQVRLAERQDELTKAEAELRDRRRAIETGREAAEQVKRIDAEIQSMQSGTCPTCGGPLSPDQTILKDLQTRRQSLADRIQACKRHLQDNQTTPETVQGLQAKVNTGATWVEAQGRLRWLAGGLEEARQRVADAEQRVASLERPDDQALAAAEKRRDDLEEQAARAREAQGHEKAIQAAQAEVRALTARRDALNSLCGYLGPHGFRQEILETRLEPLVNEVNGILQRWGMSADYQRDGFLDLMVTTPRTGEAVPYHLLSDGEQVLIQLAHQAFLAVASGVRIVVLDRIEALDKSAQQKLMQAVFDLAGPDGLLDHVLLMGVALDTVKFPAGIGVDQGYKRHELTHATAGGAPQAKTTKTTRRKTA